MKSFSQYLTESRINDVFMLFKQAYKDKFGNDKNISLDQKGSIYEIETPRGSFSVKDIGSAYKLNKYNFEGNDDWFTSAISKILRWDSRK